MNEVSIKYNFHEEVKIWALKFLKDKFDYEFTDKKNPNPALKDILTTLFSISQKQIPTQCYKIEFSQEFIWPDDPEEKKELENIIHLLSQGKDVSPYLSKLAITDEKGCILALMPKEIEDNPDLAKAGKLYLKNDGTYVSRFKKKLHKGSVREGDFCDKLIDLSELEVKIKDLNFKNKILNITSKRDHTQDNEKTPDRMLFKWNIYHLHLAKKPARSKKLLFLYIEKDMAHLVGIYEHYTWLEPEIIERIDRNWPKVLQPVTLSQQNIPAEIEKFIRAKNINSTIYLSNGKVCVQPGFIMSDGYSMDTFMNTKIFLKKIDTLTNLVEINKEIIIKELVSNSQLSSHTLRCIPENFLIQKKPGLYAEETGTYFSFS